jgi:hypothetical protein
MNTAASRATERGHSPSAMPLGPRVCRCVPGASQDGSMRGSVARVASTTMSALRTARSGELTMSTSRPSSSAARVAKRRAVSGRRLVTRTRSRSRTDAMAQS